MDCSTLEKDQDCASVGGLVSIIDLGECGDIRADFSDSAIMEIKHVISAMLRVVEFDEVDGPDGDVEVIWAASMQPFVIGKRDKGANAPVVIRPLRT